MLSAIFAGGFFREAKLWVWKEQILVALLGSTPFSVSMHNRQKWYEQNQLKVDSMLDDLAPDEGSASLINLYILAHRIFGDFGFQVDKLHMRQPSSQESTHLKVVGGKNVQKPTRT